MNIKTNGEVDLCFSNAKGDGLSADTVTAIGQTIGQVGSSLAQRQRQFTEVEQKCGKKPLVRGKARKAWDACALEYAKTAGVAPITTAPISETLPVKTEESPKKMPTWAWIALGVVALGVVGVVVYKSTASKGK